VTAARDGFQAQHLTGIVVVTGTDSTVNVTLQAGEVAQTVSVEATVPLLQTESSRLCPGRLAHNSALGVRVYLRLLFPSIRCCQRKT